MVASVIVTGGEACFASLMALNSTIFKVDLSIADVERGYYGTHSLRVARSERLVAAGEAVVERDRHRGRFRSGDGRAARGPAGHLNKL